MFFLTNLLYYFDLFTAIEREKSIAKSSRMIQSRDTIRIATQNQALQT